MSKSRTKKKGTKRPAGSTESWAARVERLFGTLNKEFLDRPMAPRPTHKAKAEAKVLFLEQVDRIVQKALRDRHKIKPAKTVVKNLASEAGGAKEEN